VGGGRHCGGGFGGGALRTLALWLLDLSRAVVYVPCFYPCFEAQPSLQGNEQPTRRRGPGKPWPRGTSGNPLGSRVVIEKRAATLADLERECGGPITGPDRVLAERGIDMLTRRPRSHNEAVRLLNAGSRIIAMLRAKYARPEVVPSLEELGLA
jgi:hypothetical protein